MMKNSATKSHAPRSFLLLLTIAGVWCFSSGVVLGEPGELASEILKATGGRGGLIVHLGCGDGALTAALHAGDGFLVQGLDANPANVEKARKKIRQRGLYGPVSAEVLYGNQLPYIDNLVNLVVSENPGPVAKSEIERVLCPGGVAYVKDNGRWVKTVKARPQNIDEWTHYLHDPSNNAVAHDSVIGPPRHLQWLGSPRWTRHHDNMSSISALVSSKGRLFYIFDEGSGWSILVPPKWSLIARDAFNGTILWKRPVARWHTRFWPLKSGPAQLPRRLVASGDRVYATLGIDAPLSALDARTGKTIRTYQNTKTAEEILLSDGVLFVLKNEHPVLIDESSVQAARRSVRQPWWDEKPRQLMAIQADTGKVLWQKSQRVMPLTLAVDGQSVYLHDGEKVVALDRANGAVRWFSPPVSRMPTLFSFFAPTLVVQEGVVLFSGGSAKTNKNGGGDNQMEALSAKDGKELWTADHPGSGYKSPEDILVSNGLVWFAGTTSGGLDGVFRGRDLHTGKVKVEFPPDVKTYWFHHRCYRGKATDKYLLMSRTGIEFVDPQAKHWDINHWVRGACLYGILPCNGLVYAPPHPCICYPESKLFGFNALAPARRNESVPAASAPNRLVRGPAYEAIQSLKSSPESPAPADWPTYRHDSGRSGYSPAPVPADLSVQWKTDLGGRLSTSVIAGDTLFVASIDAHTVYALDAASGAKRWSYTAGGRVDSPPTVYGGLALFGSADGYVTCLRASDGKLAWRFRAAPVDRRLTSFEQVESVWPVHGSVLVRKGLVTFVAGRSMFLDGGIRFFELDPFSGQVKLEEILDNRDPETGKNLQTDAKWLNMPVALPDVLSSDDKYIYMRSQRFDPSGKRFRLAPKSADRIELGADQHGEGPHLFSPTGFLDGSYFHRSYWLYGRTFAGGWNGYYVNGKFAPAGKMLVFDEKSVYGFGRKPQYYRWTTPLEHELFAASKAPPETGAIGRKPLKGSHVSVNKSKSLDPKRSALTVEAWVKATKPGGVVLAQGGPFQGYALILKNGRPRFVIRADKELSVVGAKQKVVGKWAHVAGVLTRDRKLQVYVNGKLSGKGTAHKLVPTNPAQAMEIGSDEKGGVGDYNSPFGLTGLIDEVRVYHRALSAEEIAAHFSSPKGIAKDEGLALSYSFDKGKATDLSGNGNHGRLKGVAAARGKVGQALKFSGATGNASFRVKRVWAVDLPLFVRGMVITGSANRILFVAGPPDLVDEERAARSYGDPEMQKKIAEQDLAIHGKKGALLWAVNPRTGEKVSEIRLEAPPGWDGLVAGSGRLYLSDTSGALVCYGAP